MHLQDDARISSTSSGTITIDGKGTSSDHGYAYGVTVTTLSSVSSNDGDILVNGEGGWFLGHRKMILRRSLKSTLYDWSCLRWPMAGLLGGK